MPLNDQPRWPHPVANAQFNACANAQGNASETPPHPMIALPAMARVTTQPDRAGDHLPVTGNTGPMRHGPIGARTGSVSHPFSGPHV